MQRLGCITLGCTVWSDTWRHDRCHTHNQCLPSTGYSWRRRGSLIESDDLYRSTDNPVGYHMPIMIHCTIVTSSSHLAINIGLFYMISVLCCLHPSLFSYYPSVMLDTPARSSLIAYTFFMEASIWGIRENNSAVDVQATEILLVSTICSFSTGTMGPPKRFQ